MKTRRIILAGCAFVALLVTGCNDKKTSNGQGDNDSLFMEETVDTTVYGKCGIGTAMHTLELVKGDGDTLYYQVNLDEDENVVKGGLFCGDRLAVTGFVNAEGELVAQKIINLTSLLGKWVSIDKNFEMEEGGSVKTSVRAENNPWTAWRILNGQLLLNADTFDVETLSADTLALENKKGIFVYQRQK